MRIVVVAIAFAGCVEAGPSAPSSPATPAAASSNAPPPTCPPPASKAIGHVDACQGDFQAANISTDDPQVLARLAALAPHFRCAVAPPSSGPDDPRAVCTFRVSEQSFCANGHLVEPYASEMRALATACEVTKIYAGHIR